MAEWRVALTQIELLEHPNADSLQLANADGRQFVVQKGLYEDGDWVIVVPEKSILPDRIADDGYRNYLKGTEKNRVGAVKLRGEISEGVLLNPDKWLGRDLFVPDIDFDSQTLCEMLGITQYEPPIPRELSGKVGNMKFSNFIGHDCDQFSINVDKVFKMGDTLLVTEKIHGSQVNVLLTLQNGEVTSLELASKGLGKKGIVLSEDEENRSNFYWRALANTDLVCLCQKHFYKGANEVHVQLVGEAVPVQKGFDYNLAKPEIMLFRIIVNGKSLPFHKIPFDFMDYWVPVLWMTQYGENTAQEIRELAQGESALAEHIKEGVVVSKTDEPDKYLKFINDAYQKKATGEEIN